MGGRRRRRICLHEKLEREGLRTFITGSGYGPARHFERGKLDAGDHVLNTVDVGVNFHF